MTWIFDSVISQIHTVWIHFCFSSTAIFHSPVKNVLSNVIERRLPCTPFTFHSHSVYLNFDTATHNRIKLKSLLLDFCEPALNRISLLLKHHSISLSVYLSYTHAHTLALSIFISPIFLPWVHRIALQFNCKIQRGKLEITFADEISAFIKRTKRNQMHSAAEAQAG